MRLAAAAALVFLTAVALPAAAQEPSVAISIKARRFVPPEIEVPAGAKVKLVIHNEDKVPAEFESSRLHREKVVPAGDQVVVYVGPLKPGSYEFFNDFHPASRGHLIAK